MESIPQHQDNTPQRRKIGLGGLRETFTERRLDRDRANKRALAPSVDFDNESLDRLTPEGVATVEAFYGEDVARTGERIVISSEEE